MTFQKRKIGEGPQQELSFETPKPQKPKNTVVVKSLKEAKKLIHQPKKWLFLAPVLLGAMFLVFSTLFAVYDAVSKTTFTKTLLQPALAGFEKDSAGNINMLLIGQGGGNHDGGDLADTIMVASINPDDQNVVMLSVPRDLWVDPETARSSRINEVFRNTKNILAAQTSLTGDLLEEEAIRAFMDKIEEIVNVPIPYYARVDFKGFTEVVDELGGIDVVVENDIYDETYPDGNWGVELFELDAGPQKLDGETALKFARSRHGTSDFDRAARQQQVIQAVKEKALSLGVLTSPRKIKGMLNVARKNFRTNLSVQELITLAFVGKDISKESMVSAVLNDDWNSRGGFLGTPPRADYGGAFVLIPYSGEENYDRIHMFTQLLFTYRDIQWMKFEVLNGTYIGGLATRAADRLDRYGIFVQSVGNAPGDPIPESEFWLYDDNPDLVSAFEIFQEIFPVKLVNKVGYYEEVDVAGTFIIGTDFQ